MAEKEVHITEVGNAYMVQLQVWPEGAPRHQGGIPLFHGKPIAVLSNGGSVDKDLGAAVRKALATRVRARKEKKPEVPR